MHTRAKPQGYPDPRNGTLLEMARLGDVNLRLVLVMPVDDIQEIAFMTGLAGRDVTVLLDRAGRSNEQVGRFPALHIEAGEHVESGTYRAGENGRTASHVDPPVVVAVVFFVSAETGADSVAAEAVYTALPVSALEPAEVEPVLDEVAPAPVAALEAFD